MSKKSEAKANFLKDLRALEAEGKPTPKTTEIVEKEEMKKKAAKKEKSLTSLVETQGKKLVKVERERVITWISEFNTSTEVAGLVKEFFGKDVTPQNVDYYQKRYAETIEKKQKKFLEELMTIPEANKTVRVKRLSEMAGDLRKKMGLPTKGWLNFVDRYCSVLKQIADEVEGGSGGVTVPIQINIGEDREKFK